MRKRGVSGLADCFDAGVSVGAAGAALFYVIAHRDTPDAAVHSVGGEVFARRAHPPQPRVVAPHAAHAQLRDHRDLRLAGPVTVDPQRFRHFTELVGAAAPAAREATSTPTTSTEVSIH